MRLRRIGTAAVALALTAPATAHAATWTVTPGGGGCGGSDHQCGTIGQANTAANGSGDASDLILIVPRAGDWDEDVAFTKSGLTLRGSGPGIPRVRGRLTFDGSGTAAQTFSVQRMAIHADAGGPALRVSSSGLNGDKTVRLESTVLSGHGELPAIEASTDVGVENDIAIVARHVTVADAASAPAVTEAESGGEIAVSFFDSIVQGAKAGASETNSEPTTNGASLFVDPDDTEDFRLRVGSPAIDGGGFRQDGEWEEDVGGETRAGTWDRGGDELVNRAPSKPSVSPSASQVERGQAVGLAVSGATDPDGALGDDVVKYVWDFGDGTVEERTPGSWAHMYAAAGRYEVRVRAVDRTNTSGPASDPVAIVVKDPPPPPPSGGGITSLTQLPGFEAGYEPNRRGPDAGPPFVALTWPRTGARVRIRRGVPLLRGRTADPSGVRRVDLAVMRREGRRCRWFDGREAFRLGSCTAPVWFKAILDDFDWRYAFPRRVRPRPGAYFAFARATDYLGKQTPPSRAIGFRYTR
ncbi:MAG: PKD domain-containing protein [Actinomycetota bacterium]|nr:PKD domain-containing protein [Actinomycetota bacterium]